MKSKRQQILKWVAQGHIATKDIDEALEITQSNNNKWYGFIRQSLLWLSVLSIAFGVIFFFAYNWDNISVFTKFILIQGLILFSLFFYTQITSQSQASTATLFFLALLIGSLFALFGQTYQSGKDPWQLFMLWTLFITPLAFTSRSSSLWLLWLLLANVTLNLVLHVRYGLLGFLFDNERNLLLYAFLNFVAASSFEFLYHSKYKLINSRVASQVAIVVTMVAFTWVSIYSVFEIGKKSFDLLFYLGWMTSVYYFYRVKTMDIMVLSSWVISGIVFIIFSIARIVNNDFDGAIFLILGLLIIGMSTMGVKWLMKLLKESHDHGEAS